MKKFLKNSLLFLTGASLSGNAIAADFEVDSISYNVLSLTELTCGVVSSSKTSPEIVIPETVTYNSYSLTVTSIEESAFEKNGLKSIILPNSVKNIGNSAFRNCENLNNISLGEGVETIGNNAFTSCIGLKSILIPKSVQHIGTQAFYGASSLEAVHITDLSAWCRIYFDYKEYGSYGSTANPIVYANNLYLNGNLVTSLRIPDDVTGGIPCYAFTGCKCLTEVIIPQNITQVGFRSFAGCTNIKNLIIEDGDTPLNVHYAWYYHSDYPGWFKDSPIETLYIGRNIENTKSDFSAFRENNELTELTFGKSVTAIEEYSFANCENIQNIKVLSSVPPTINAENAFSTKTYTNAIVSVPQGSLSEYQSATHWMSFFALKEQTDVQTYKLSANYNDTFGKVLINGSAQGPTFVEENSIVEFTIIPYNKYMVEKVLLNGIDITNNLSENKYTVNSISEDQTLDVIFAERDDIQMTISHAENGSVTIDADYGQSFKIDITPNSGWMLNTVTFNGSDVTSQINDGWYTTPEITEASTISIVFESMNDNVVETRISDSNIKVYGYNKSITVSGVEPTDTIYVFNANGQQIFSGNDTTINIANTGIFFVKVAGKTFKVAL